MSKVEAVILDWAGTAVDFGSLAPVRAVTALFKNEDVPIEDREARRDMGIFKKDHIRRILQMPRVEAAWKAKRGESPSETDVENLFAKFIPLQMDVLEQHATVIPGVVEACESFRKRGLKIGSTTGYTRPMLDVLVASARSQGYAPDLAFCPDDVGGGRPLPWMCLRIAVEFRVASVSAVVKAGDTPSDIEEDRNAGMWAVGVAATGNAIGMDQTAFEELHGDVQRELIAQAISELKTAGSHYVVESVSALGPVLDEIDVRLQRGERP